jgi:hypothetical protein
MLNALISVLLKKLLVSLSKVIVINLQRDTANF